MRTEHLATVREFYKPEHAWEEDGETFVMPALLQWMVICPTHEYYFPATFLWADLERVGAESFDRLLELLHDEAQLEFTHHGCGARVPAFEVPGVRGATPQEA